MRFRHLLFFLAMLSIFGGRPIMAEPFSGIVAFGDSLSDAGNVFLATNGQLPAPPYFNGHFSNGPTWVEDLSQTLGLGTLRPSLAGGMDFAYGSAITGNSVPGASSAVPNITQQVGQFLSATGGLAPAADLYTVWIGSNDVFQAVTDVVANPPSLGMIETALGNAAQTEAGAVNTLATAGAKTFIVPLLPDLGKAPLAAAAASLATELSALYNADLLTDLKALITSDAITIDFLDTFSLIDAAVANPGAFGLTNVTDPCYTGPFTGGPPAPCSTPAAYLFWDGQHPTDTGHELIAGLAENTVPVPEPPTLPIFLVAGLIVTLCRCFRQNRDQGVKP